jgi:REP element-mobilizing transposase RayT
MRIRKYLLPTLEHLHIHNRGYLPHWELRHAIYSITFRLHDSLPIHVRKSLHEEHRALRRRYACDERNPTAIENARIRFALERALDRELDSGHGSAWLREDRIAQVVVDALHYFDGRHYDLFAWCVMPNHVHVVIRLGNRLHLWEVMRSWKTYSSRVANYLLGRTGAFWFREYFDRIVRNDEDFEKTIGYVLGNPDKAGLKDWPWTWTADRRSADRPA